LFDLAFVCTADIQFYLGKNIAGHQCKWLHCCKDIEPTLPSVGQK